MKKMNLEFKKDKQKINETKNNVEELAIDINTNKKAKKIKIKVHDKENNKKINLPALPMGILETFASVAYKLSLKYNREYTGKVADDEIIELFKTLRELPPFTLVDIDTEEARVEIYTK